MVMIVLWLDSQLHVPVKSVPITIKVVGSNLNNRSLENWLCCQPKQIRSCDPMTKMSKNEQ
jgi:hypothetical protein